VTAATVDVDRSVDPLEVRWIELAGGGDENAFAVLVRQYQDQLYRVALRMLGISESAAKVRAHRARRALSSVLQEWR
jgi:DNA-directed RNA polymerase specialized sigma24 family protein